MLVARQETLNTLYKQARTLRQSDAFTPAEAPRVFLASTAYNFLNVYRDVSNKAGDVPASENSVHCLEFAKEESAEVVFAILSSRLVYWLWHASGDGFHVRNGRRFHPIRYIVVHIRSIGDASATWRELWSSCRAPGFERESRQADYRFPASCVRP